MMTNDDDRIEALTDQELLDHAIDVGDIVGEIPEYIALVYREYVRAVGNDAEAREWIVEGRVDDPDRTDELEEMYWYVENLVLAIIYSRLYETQLEKLTANLGAYLDMKVRLCGS